MKNLIKNKEENKDKNNGKKKKKKKKLETLMLNHYILYTITIAKIIKLPIQ